MRTQHFATFASLFLLLIIDVMGFGLVFPLLGPIFMDTQNGILPLATSPLMRNIYYGLTISVFEISLFVGAPIAGDLSDHIGRKKMLICSMLGTAAGYAIAAFGVAHKFIALLLLGRILAGITAGSQPIAQAAIADISTQENKAKNFGLICFAMSLGFVAGPICGGYFAHSATIAWFNYSTPFIVAGILALFNAICILITFKETFTPRAKHQLRLNRCFEIFTQAFKDKRIRIFALIMLLMQLSWSLYFQFISLYLNQSFHFSTERTGWFMAYLGVLFGLSLTLIMNYLLKFFELRRLVKINLIIMAIGILGLCLTHAEIWQWLCVMPIVVGSALVYNGIVTICSNDTDADTQGWLMGIFSAIVSLAWAITGVISSLLGYFNLRLPFYGSFILLLIAFAIMHYHSQRKQ